MKRPRDKKRSPSESMLARYSPGAEKTVTYKRCALQLGFAPHGQKRPRLNVTKTGMCPEGMEHIGGMRQVKRCFPMCVLLAILLIAKDVAVVQKRNEYLEIGEMIQHIDCPQRIKGASVGKIGGLNPTHLEMTLLQTPA